MNKFFLIMIFNFLLISCNSLQSLKTLLNKNPRDRYIEKLQKAGLAKSNLYQKWILAGELALKDSIIVDLPFSESGYFASERPGARTFQFEINEGQVVQVSGQLKAIPETKLFMELFWLDEQQWKLKSATDSLGSLIYEANQKGKCLLRIQPELLAAVYYIIHVEVTTAFINPVSGAGNSSIGSIYGVDREGGKRKHEGIDIFARKGTPVLAPTDGVIADVGTNKLGGNVIWMFDMKRRQSYYFAHLDSQLVRPGYSAKQGDTIGTVGNSGNAANTPPHLHFGIYKQGSKDPFSYIHRNSLPQREHIFMDSTFVFGEYTNSKELKVYSNPGNSNRVQSIAAHSLIYVIGQSKQFFRIQNLDHSQGYVSNKGIAPIHSMEKIELKKQKIFLSGPIESAIPIDTLQAGDFLHLLAKSGMYSYVKRPDGYKGWIEND